VQRWLAFTLIEIVLAVFILMLLLLLAVPSLSGVLIVWREKGVLLRPEVLAKDQKAAATVELKLDRGEALTLKLPAALTKTPPAEWIFWPSGTCEPATVQFKGAAGSWTANYLPLTARPELTNYATR